MFYFAKCKLRQKTSNLLNQITFWGRRGGGEHLKMNVPVRDCPTVEAQNFVQHWLEFNGLEAIVSNDISAVRRLFLSTFLSIGN